MAEPSTPAPVGHTPPAQAGAASESARAGILKEKVNDPARTGFDPQTKWWTNYFKMLSGQMTTEGKFHFREWTHASQEEKDCKRCEEYRDWLFTYSPTVRFLSDKIEDLNGKIDRDNVLCRRCPRQLTEDGQIRGQTGGFDPNIGILLCANEVRNRKHLEDTLSHEMVHAWDHLRWKVDWLGDKDLKQSACTEIRASMLSGECRWAREFFERNNWSLTQQFQNCVRKRATMSVMARPSCQGEEHASKIVNKVWESCFNDTRPFDEVFR